MCVSVQCIHRYQYMSWYCVAETQDYSHNNTLLMYSRKFANSCASDNVGIHLCLQRMQKFQVRLLILCDRQMWKKGRDSKNSILIKCNCRLFLIILSSNSSFPSSFLFFFFFLFFFCFFRLLPPSWILYLHDSFMV